ncbi:MAG: hypothetical protein II956_12735 [Bacteroidales bacterium]|nr:hypothetical protein [Bacteroidales bacterium]
MQIPDDNLKAKFADYINGKKVSLTDEELELLSSDDALAAECLEIAEFSSQYDTQEVDRNVKTFKLNVLLLSVAACLTVALLVTVFYENADKNSTTAALTPNENPQKGWGEISTNATGTVQTASTMSGSGFYTAAPDTPFEVEPAQQDDIQENDLVKIFTTENPTPIMQTNIKAEKSNDKKDKKKVKKIKFKDGLAEGLYEYRVFHNDVQVDQGGIVIGED